MVVVVLLGYRVLFAPGRDATTDGQFENRNAGSGFVHVQKRKNPETNRSETTVKFRRDRRVNVHIRLTFTVDISRTISSAYCIRSLGQFTGAQYSVTLRGTRAFPTEVTDVRFNRNL